MGWQHLYANLFPASDYSTHADTAAPVPFYTEGAGFSFKGHPSPR